MSEEQQFRYYLTVILEFCSTPHYIFRLLNVILMTGFHKFFKLLSDYIFISCCFLILPLYLLEAASYVLHLKDYKLKHCIGVAVYTN